MTELLQAHSRLMLVPSYTTRSMRPNEKNGRKYWHITSDEFKKDIAD
jgi:guanylate kinase